MTPATRSCVLLAERHPVLADRIRGLLATWFEAVVMVADEKSLVESTQRLCPAITVVDLSLPFTGNLDWIQRLHELCPRMKVVLMSVHDEPGVREAALEEGADGFVLKRSLATELMPIVESLMKDSLSR